MKNPNCDNDKCCVLNGEVRLLPTSQRSNAILCFTCFQHELRWRKERNKEVANPFPLPRWEDLKVYGESK